MTQPGQPQYPQEPEGYQPPQNAPGQQYPQQQYPEQPFPQAQNPQAFQATQYGQPPYGQQQYPQPQNPQAPYEPAQYGQQPYSQQPYGQQPYGQPYGPAQGWAGAPVPQQRRPVWKTVLGVILIVIGSLGTLGLLSNLASGRFANGIGGGSYLIGYLFGTLLVSLVPLGIGIFLLTRKK